MIGQLTRFIRSTSESWRQYFTTLDQHHGIRIIAFPNYKTMRLGIQLAIAYSKQPFHREGLAVRIGRSLDTDSSKTIRIVGYSGGIDLYSTSVNPQTSGLWYIEILFPFGKRMNVSRTSQFERT